MHDRRTHTAAHTSLLSLSAFKIPSCVAIYRHCGCHSLCVCYIYNYVCIYNHVCYILYINYISFSFGTKCLSYALEFLKEFIFCYFHEVNIFAVYMRFIFSLFLWTFQRNFSPCANNTLRTDIWQTLNFIDDQWLVKSCLLTTEATTDLASHEASSYGDTTHIELGYTENPPPTMSTPDRWV